MVAAKTWRCGEMRDGQGSLEDWSKVTDIIMPPLIRGAREEEWSGGWEFGVVIDMSERRETMDI
jgi:hypothetical protein